jgi:hypothetical protein
MTCPPRNRVGTYLAGFGIMRPLWISLVTAFRERALTAGFDFSQASVTELSIICRYTLLQFGQVNVRKSRPVLLGSIAESFMGEPQAVH